MAFSTPADLIGILAVGLLIDEIRYFLQALLDFVTVLSSQFLRLLYEISDTHLLYFLCQRLEHRPRTGSDSGRVPALLGYARGVTRSTWTLLAFATLVSISCTGSPVTQSSTSSAPTEPVGRIAIIEDSGNIVVLDPDGSNRVDITDDGESVRYFQPIFSPESATLAWSEGRSDGFGVGIATADGSDRFTVTLGDFPFYLNWAPDGQRIGLLHNGSAGGVDMEILDVADREVGPFDNGSPYYFSWSPDGDALVVHSDGTSLQIFDESADPMDIGPTRSDYLAPHWTTGGIFYVAPEGLAIRRTAEAEPQILADIAGFVNVYPNQQGTLVAAHVIADVAPEIEVSLTAQETLEPNRVSIVDSTTGEVVAASDMPSIGSFWSPDGSKLLMLLLTPANGEFDAVVWEAGETTTLARVELPVSLIGEALQFSDQYAESWQMWSPGSDAVVLPGTVDQERGIWMMPLEGSPQRIGDGEWAAWSHG